MLGNLEIIAPIFIIMLIGFLMGKTKVFPEGSGTARSLTSFVWFVAIPALLFKLLAANRFPTGEEFQLVLGYYFVLFIIYFSSVFFIAPRMHIEKQGVGIFAFSSCFGNLGFIGISLVQGAFGEEGLRILLMLISFHMITLLPITTLITELARQNSGSPLSVLFAALKRSAKNPIVVTLCIALGWAATGIGISPIVMRILDFPAAAAAPVGLFAVGLSLSRVKLKGNFIQALAPVMIKLMLFPVAVYFMLHLVMDVPDLWAKTATLAACMPTGMASYTIAEQYNHGTELAASTIMLGTLLSTVTLMVAISLLI